MRIDTPVLFLSRSLPEGNALSNRTRLESALHNCEVELPNSEHITLNIRNKSPIDDAEYADLHAWRREHPEGRIIAMGAAVQEWLNHREMGYTPMASLHSNDILRDPARIAVHLGATLGCMLERGPMVQWTPAERAALMPTDDDPYLRECAPLFNRIGHASGQAIATRIVDEASTDSNLALEHQPIALPRIIKKEESAWEARKHMVRKDHEALKGIIPHGGVVPDTYNKETPESQRIGWRMSLLRTYHNPETNTVEFRPKTNMYQPVLCNSHFIFYINPNDHDPAHLHVFTRHGRNPVTSARLAFVREADGLVHLVPYYYSNMFKKSEPVAAGSPPRYSISDEPYRPEKERFDLSTENLNRAVIAASVNGEYLLERWNALRKRIGMPVEGLELNEDPTTHIRSIGYEGRLQFMPSASFRRASA